MMSSLYFSKYSLAFMASLSFADKSTQLFFLAVLRSGLPSVWKQKAAATMGQGDKPFSPNCAIPCRATRPAVLDPRRFRIFIQAYPEYPSKTDKAVMQKRNASNLFQFLGMRENLGKLRNAGVVQRD
jgi:hypothetical protein